MNNTHDDQNTILSPPPPWEVLVLVSQHLDPKSLAISSCVSKSWFSCFSSDHLWSPLCSTHFPSLSSLSAATSTPFRRLYSLGHAAFLLRHRSPRRPRLSLHRLLFTISLGKSYPLLTLVKPCRGLERDPHGLFRFDLNVEEEREWGVEELREARVTWNVVAVGEEERDQWKGVFTMAEESGGKKGGFATSFGVDGWFSEELPSPPGMMSSGLMADLRLGVAAVEGGGEQGMRGRRSGRGEDGKVRIEKISVGVMSLQNWRYVSIDDTLSYLDHFLPF